MQFQQKVTQYLNDKKRRRRLTALLVVLSILVSMTVTMGLMQPVVTMTPDVVCGLAAHSHAPACYDGDALICGLEEHAHEASCYPEAVADPIIAPAEDEGEEVSSVTLNLGDHDEFPEDIEAEWLLDAPGSVEACYGRVLRANAPVWHDAEAENAMAALGMGEVVMMEGRAAAGRERVTYYVHEGFVNGYMDASDIARMTEPEIDAYMDAISEEAEVALYQDDIDRPLAPAHCVFFEPEEPADEQEAAAEPAEEGTIEEAKEPIEEKEEISEEEKDEIAEEDKEEPSEEEKDEIAEEDKEEPSEEAKDEITEEKEEPSEEVKDEIAEEKEEPSEEVKDEIAEEDKEEPSEEKEELSEEKEEPSEEKEEPSEKKEEPSEEKEEPSEEKEEPSEEKEEPSEEKEESSEEKEEPIEEKEEPSEEKEEPIEEKEEDAEEKKETSEEEETSEEIEENKPSEGETTAEEEEIAEEEEEEPIKEESEGAEEASDAIDATCAIRLTAQSDLIQLGDTAIFEYEVSNAAALRARIETADGEELLSTELDVESVQLEYLPEAAGRYVFILTAESQASTDDVESEDETIEDLAVPAEAMGDEPAGETEIHTVSATCEFEVVEAEEEAAEDVDEPGTETIERVFEGGDFTVRVCYTAEANLPEDVTLAVSEIAPGTPEYQAYADQMGVTLSEAGSEMGAFARLFDIAFMWEGEELEPSAPVQVEIAFRDAVELDAESELAAVHFAEDGAQVLDTDGSGSAGVSFETPSFSVFGVVQVSAVRTRVITANGERFLIEVTYEPEAQIPMNAELIAEEIIEGSAEYESCVDQALAAMSEVEELGFARFFDITIVDGEGRKLEPAAPVQVRITYDEADVAEDEPMYAVHFAENGESPVTEIIDTTVSAAGEGGLAVTFTQGSFSITGTVSPVWPKNGWIGSGSWEWNAFPVEDGRYLILVQRGREYYALCSDRTMRQVAYNPSATYDHDHPFVFGDSGETADDLKSYIWNYSETVTFGDRRYGHYYFKSEDGKWLNELDRSGDPKPIRIGDNNQYRYATLTPEIAYPNDDTSETPYTVYQQYGEVYTMKDRDEEGNSYYNRALYAWPGEPWKWEEHNDAHDAHYVQKQNIVYISLKDVTYAGGSQGSDRGAFPEKNGKYFFIYEANGQHYALGANGQVSRLGAIPKIDGALDLRGVDLGALSTDYEWNYKRTITDGGNEYGENYFYAETNGETYWMTGTEDGNSIANSMTVGDSGNYRAARTAYDVYDNSSGVYRQSPNYGNNGDYYLRFNDDKTRWEWYKGAQSPDCINGRDNSYFVPIRTINYYTDSSFEWLGNGIPAKIQHWKDPVSVVGSNGVDVVAGTSYTVRNVSDQHRISYATKPRKDGSQNYYQFTYKFAAWKGDNGKLYFPGDTIDFTTDDVTTLTALWIGHFDGDPPKFDDEYYKIYKRDYQNNHAATDTIAFYVVTDGTSGKFTPEKKYSYTGAVFTTNFKHAPNPYLEDGTDIYGRYGYGVNEFNTVFLGNNQGLANATWKDYEDLDKEIEKLRDGVTIERTIKGVERQLFYQVNYFPTDAEILAAVRDDLNRTGKHIYVDGVRIKPQDINTTHFKVFWYMFSDTISDGWHIDGIIRRRPAALTVTKSFEGNPISIKQVQESGYFVSVTQDHEGMENETPDPFYVLTLNGTNPSGNSGAIPIAPKTVDKTTIDGEEYVTGVTWVIENDDRLIPSIRRDADTVLNPVTVTEHNYVASLPGDVKTSTRVSVANTGDLLKGEIVTDEDSFGIEKLSVYSYPVYVTDHRQYQTVALTNTYRNPTALSIIKQDAKTGNGMKASFTLTVRSADAATGDFIQRFTGTTNEAGYLEISMPENMGYGEYEFVLEEDRIDGYKTENFRYWGKLTVPNTGTPFLHDVKHVAEDGTTEESVDIDPNDPLRLVAVNYSETTQLKVRKKWELVGTPPSEIKPVMVQLLSNGTPATNITDYLVFLNGTDISIPEGKRPEAEYIEGWEYTWENLPEYMDGKKVEYSVRELWIGNPADPEAISYRYAYDANDPDGDGFKDFIVKYDTLIENDVTVHKVSNTPGREQQRVALAKVEDDAGNPDHWYETLSDYANYVKPAYVGMTAGENGNRALSGVKFTLFSNAALTAVAKNTSGRILENLTTGADGLIDFGELIRGTYYLVETGTVEGYALNQTPTVITVSQDGVTYSPFGGAETNAKVSHIDDYGRFLGTGSYTGSWSVNQNGSRVNPVDGTTTYLLGLSNKRKQNVALLKKPNTATSWIENGQPKDVGLTGARFTLYADAAHTTLATNEAGSTFEDAEVDDKGILRFGDLPEGTYYLVETEAPPGYNRMVGNVTIRVEGNRVTLGNSTEEAKATRVDGAGRFPGQDGFDKASATDAYIFAVNNTAGVALPNTGGPGSTLYSVCGIALIALSALIYGCELRRRRERGSTGS